ncbi:hypothetical protein M5K25_018759 [Dendrobium thyrsiflorum]|uniref:Uncharacterized protein n=1 Tax=Dendrobium thyrsiflorum TaxID=117978 RepID=A0ABD0UD27_DENTH
MSTPSNQPIEGQDEHDPTKPTLQNIQLQDAEEDSPQGSSTDPIQNELFKIQRLMYLVDTKFDKKVREIHANLEHEKKLINDKYAKMIQDLHRSSKETSDSDSSGDEIFQVEESDVGKGSQNNLQNLEVFGSFGAHGFGCFGSCCSIKRHFIGISFEVFMATFAEETLVFLVCVCPFGFLSIPSVSCWPPRFLVGGLRLPCWVAVPVPAVWDFVLSFGFYSLALRFPAVPCF